MTFPFTHWTYLLWQVLGSCSYFWEAQKAFPQEQRAAGERPKRWNVWYNFFSHRLAMCSLILIYLEDFACGECVTYYFKEDKYWFILVLFVLLPLLLGPCHSVAPAPSHLGQDWAFPHPPPSTSLPCLLVCGELRLTVDRGLQEEETGLVNSLWVCDS